MRCVPDGPVVTHDKSFFNSILVFDCRLLPNDGPVIRLG